MQLTDTYTSRRQKLLKTLATKSRNQELNMEIRANQGFVAIVVFMALAMLLGMIVLHFQPRPVGSAFDAYYQNYGEQTED